MHASKAYAADNEERHHASKTASRQARRLTRLKKRHEFEQTT